MIERATMDNAVKVAEVAWENVYFFKIDHKNGYHHVPIYEDSWKFFVVFWKGIYYVFAVLPFGLKCSPFIILLQRLLLCTAGL